MNASTLAEKIQMKLHEQKISVSEFERSAGLKDWLLRTSLLVKVKIQPLKLSFQLQKGLAVLSKI